MAKKVITNGLFNRVNPLVENYQAIRAKYRSGVGEGGGFANRAPITDRHGFMLNRGGSLGERFAGLDKLFYTLIQGVVEDPDYAVKKDSKIYERMLRDPQIYYCLMVRKAAVSSLPWIIKPKMTMSQDASAKQFAKSAEERIKQIPRFSELVDNMMDSILPGLSVNELIWKVGSKGHYIVDNHFPVNKDRVKFNKKGDLYLLSPNSPTAGMKVPPYKFICHTFNTTDGSWVKPETAGYAFYGRGLADTPLYHYFHFKMMALKYFLKSLERYGMPFKIIYTGAQNTALADKMSEIMLALKNDAVVSVPGKKGDVNVEIDHAKSAKENMFLNFIEYVDKLITKSILGQELMTEMPGVGSYAAASIHKSVFALLNARDRDKIKDVLNRTLLTYDAQLNTPNLAEEYRPVFDFRRSPVEETDTFLNTVKMAMELGLATSEAQVREYTGLREPMPGEKVLQRPEPPTVPNVEMDENELQNQNQN